MDGSMTMTTGSITKAKSPDKLCSTPWNAAVWVHSAWYINYMLDSVSSDTRVWNCNKFSSVWLLLMNEDGEKMWFVAVSLIYNKLLSPLAENVLLFYTIFVRFFPNTNIVFYFYRLKRGYLSTYMFNCGSFRSDKFFLPYFKYSAFGNKHNLFLLINVLFSFNHIFSLLFQAVFEEQQQQPGDGWGGGVSYAWTADGTWKRTSNLEVRPTTWPLQSEWKHKESKTYHDTKGSSKYFSKFASCTHWFIMGFDCVNSCCQLHFSLRNDFSLFLILSTNTFYNFLINLT